MKITRERGGDQFPPNSVVVRVERGLFPCPFSSNTDYDESDKPYQRVHKYNLVIMPSGVVNSQNKSWNRLEYASIYSGKSGRMYSWADFYRGSYFEPGVEVSGPQILVDCLPNKGHHKPPRAVNVYASTAGVVWLALRETMEKYRSQDLGPNGQRLVSLEDAPFATYLEMLDEMYPDDNLDISNIRDRLRTFFGM